MDLFADLAAGCDEHQDKLGVFSRMKHAAKVRIIAGEFDDVGRVWFVCKHAIRIPQLILTVPTSKRSRPAVTKPGGTISNVGYHGSGEFVSIPRVAWGVGMADKTIRTGLCPGGSLRMERLLRILERGLVDPTKMTTHPFSFEEMPRAFEIMDKKLDGVLKPLIIF